MRGYGDGWLEADEAEYQLPWAGGSERPGRKKDLTRSDTLAGRLIPGKILLAYQPPCE